MPNSALTAAQRFLLRITVVLGALVLANSAWLAAVSLHEEARPDARGILPVFHQVMLLVHFAGGILLVVLAVVFAAWHLRRVLRLRRRGAVATGAAVTLAAALLLVTGLFILTEARSRQNAGMVLAHRLLAVAAPILYLVHRVRSRVPPGPAARRAVAVAAAALLVLGTGAFVATLPEIPSPVPGVRSEADFAAGDPFLARGPFGVVPEASPFFPAATGTGSGGTITARLLLGPMTPAPEALKADIAAHGFVVNHAIGSDACVRCHPDVVAQWKDSAHRFSSFNNPFYAAAVNLMREPGVRGPQASQWCGGCHDPAILLAGNMARDFDPHAADAQAGLTCLACHSIDSIHDTTGNGNYRIDDRQPSPYLFADADPGLLRSIHDGLLKARPEAHRRAMLRPFFRTSEFCSTCHKVSLDVPVNRYRWIRGQNEYDAWHDSGIALNAARTFYLPPAPRECQDCHMPPEDAPLGDVSARNGKVRSHRFIAINTALPHIRGDTATLKRIEAFLRDGKLRLDVFALEGGDGRRFLALDRARPVLRPGDVATFEVVLRNQGVGHTFPGGTNDSNEGWLDAKATMGDTVILRSGALDAEGHLDPGAHTYGAVLIDHEGGRIDRRNPWDIRTTLFAHVVGPGTADVVRYRLRVPEAPGQSLRFHVALAFRKFDRAYTLFAWRGRSPVPDLPVTIIAEAEVDLPIGSEEGASAAGAAPPVPGDWVRFNDHGIGLLLQNQTRAARASFEEVARLAPLRPDGPLNLARVALAEGDLGTARRHLDEAEARAPGDPRTQFWWADYWMKENTLENAEQALLVVLRTFPEDRDSLRRLARVRHRLGRHEAALAALRDVLAIDPEDRESHELRQYALKALGRPGDARAAMDLFRRYQIDESIGSLTLGYRQAHPHHHREAEPVHVHE